MLNIFSAKQAKQAARVLERFMNAKGCELKLGQALEALAQMSGNKNWAALSQRLTEEVANRELSSMELLHATTSAGDGYGEECALVAHTGFELRYGAQGDGVDYVRVCDPLGREIAYWVDDEWREDPQVVMGAILGALVRGRPVEVGKKPAEQASTESSVPFPKIQDVPWSQLSHLFLNGDYFDVRYREDGELARLYKDPMLPTGQEEDELEHETALGLGKEEDGLVWDEQLSVATLRRLVWDGAKKMFVDPENEDEYQFVLARAFGH